MLNRSYLPDHLLDKMMQSIEIVLGLSVPEGLGQELAVQLDDALVGADCIVQLRILEPMVEVGKVIKSDMKGYRVG